MTIDDLSRLRELARAATPGPWTPGHQPDDRDPLDYLRETLSYGNSPRIHLVCVPFEGKPLDEEAKFTAVTGNGPTSEANAAFIAACNPTTILALLDENTRLAAECHGRRFDPNLVAENASLRSQLATVRAQADTLLAVNDEQEKECERLRARVAESGARIEAQRTSLAKRIDQLSAMTAARDSLADIAEAATFVIDNVACASCRAMIDNIPVENIDALRKVGAP